MTDEASSTSDLELIGIALRAAISAPMSHADAELDPQLCSPVGALEFTLRTSNELTAIVVDVGQAFGSLAQEAFSSCGTASAVESRRHLVDEALLLPKGCVAAIGEAAATNAPFATVPETERLLVRLADLSTSVGALIDDLALEVSERIAVEVAGLRSNPLHVVNMSLSWQPVVPEGPLAEVHTALQDLRTFLGIEDEPRTYAQPAFPPPSLSPSGVVVWICGFGHQVDLSSSRCEPCVVRIESGRSASDPYVVRNAYDAEQAAAAALMSWGFSDAAVSPIGPDGGVDVSATGAVAQVKAQAVPVGRPMVQQLYGVASVRSVMPTFFALAGFTQQATEWATEFGVAAFDFNYADGVRPVNTLARVLSRSGSGSVENALTDAAEVAQDFAPTTPQGLCATRWLADLGWVPHAQIIGGLFCAGAADRQSPEYIEGVGYILRARIQDPSSDVGSIWL